MADTRTNPVLKWVALGVIVLGGVLLFKGSNHNDDETAQTSKSKLDQDEALQRELAAMNIDADSPTETIRTLIAHVKSQEQQTRKVVQLNEELRQENQATDKKVENEVKVKVHKMQQEMETKNSHLLQGVTGRMNELAGMLKNQTAQAVGVGLENKGDIPVGLGFDGFSNTDQGWVLPLDLPEADEQGVIHLPDVSHDNEQDLFSDLDNPVKQAVSEVKKIAWYTVPENATLMGATSMTGMIGRIPVNGQVTAPYPFKIIVSSYNLATNGHHIPGLDGMIFSGIATGDLMLSCISAKLYSVTYTFDDGTILTQREDGNSTGGGGKGGGGQGAAVQRRGLGWLSDEWGNPCIKGELITNAPTFLASMFGLSAAEGYARAVADNETTSVVTSSGSVVDSTTGSATKRAGGEAVADGVAGIKQWMVARQQDSFDAIFVPSGTKVAVHIDTQLEIDYDPRGRKLAYEHQNQPGYTRQLD